MAEQPEHKILVPTPRVVKPGDAEWSSVGKNEEQPMVQPSYTQAKAARDAQQQD